MVLVFLLVAAQFLSSAFSLVYFLSSAFSFVTLSPLHSLCNTFSGTYSVVHFLYCKFSHRYTFPGTFSLEGTYSLAYFFLVDFLSGTFSFWYLLILWYNFLRCIFSGPFSSIYFLWYIFFTSFYLVFLFSDAHFLVHFSQAHFLHNTFSSVHLFSLLIGVTYMCGADH